MTGTTVSNNGDEVGCAVCMESW